MFLAKFGADRAAPAPIGARGSDDVGGDATERLSAIVYHITCIICGDTLLDCTYEVRVEWVGGFGHDELGGGVCRLQSDR